MRRTYRGLLVLGVFLVFVQIFAGCGGGGSGYHVFTAYVMSDQPSDGDIGFLAGGTPPYKVTQGPDTLFFGLDADYREYRAFLDFPLDGSTSQDVIPLNAQIESATLTVRIVSVDYVSSVRTILDLVTYDYSNLNASDYNSPPIATRSAFSLYLSDVGRDVVIDVTSFMREVQARGLSDFQVRFRLGGLDGFVGIDDRFDVAITAPLLTVRYY